MDVYKDLLTEEFIKGEKISWIFRWVLYLLLFVLALVVYLVQDLRIGLYGMFLTMGAIAYNILLTPLIRKKAHFAWIRYFSVSIDVVFLTAYNALDSYFNSPLVPVTSATLILYPVLLFLASLRIDRRLIVYATFLSIVSMNILFGISYQHFDKNVASKLVSADILGEVYRSLYVCLCGMLMFFIPGTIERLLKAQKKMYDESMVHFKLARSDKLTGLANRVSIDEYLPIEIARAERNQSKLAIFYLDLDGFKPVNDNFGHDAGDKVLAEVGRRLKTVIREYDMAARLGGDEFVVVIDDADGKDLRDSIQKRTADVFNQPFEISDKKIIIGTSIGMSVYPDDAKESAKLIDFADKAMLTQKKRRAI
jgi:diguanylate cyclase (GGDEF)-like protein